MTRARAGQRRDGAPGTNNGDTRSPRVVPIGGEIDVEFAVTFGARVALKKCDFRKNPVPHRWPTSRTPTRAISRGKAASPGCLLASFRPAQPNRASHLTDGESPWMTLF